MNLHRQLAVPCFTGFKNFAATDRHGTISAGIRQLHAAQRLQTNLQLRTADRWGVLLGHHQPDERRNGGLRRQDAPRFVRPRLGEIGLAFRLGLGVRVKMCLALKSVEDKSNEIPAVQQLIDLLDLAGAVVTADAMHCQRETAGKIITI